MISHARNIRRNITRKWVEAKPVNYEGDDWGNEDDYAYGPVPPPPAETPRSVWRQIQTRNQHQQPNQYEDQGQLSNPEIPPINHPEQQFQQYPLPIPPRKPLDPAVRKQISPGPDILQQQQQQPPITSPVSPPTHPATPVLSSDQNVSPISRSETMSETRRRNQRAMLALMSQGNFG
jgi:hypothetical protein